jgi:ribosomal protein S18 acetylase RimI-like enzyme
MNEGISVWTCNAKDIDTLVSLGIKTFRDTFDEFNTPENMILYINNTFTRKIIEQEMKQPGTVFFLAFDGRKPAGYAKIKASQNPDGLSDASALEIERLYVHKSYLGKRVGYMLMQTCLAFAKKKGYREVWLGVWENNARAISFYERNGFMRFGQHTFMLGTDPQTDWLMKKVLLPATENKKQIA